ncbi:hypothetical protein KP509_01G043500 [Ceratopteris richardii]|nr:hypothetical protein KP509_01G043500 [Ceratopteris richardii]
MQAGISVSIQQHMGTIWMDVLQSGTYIDTVQVQLNGGSSWLYQWLVDSLEEWMRTTIEEQLNEQIQQCIQNLNSFLLQTPQQVHVDDVSELNFTVVTEPIVNPTSLSIGIKGEFISTRLSKFGPQHSLELPSGLVCDGDATMVTIALSESILKDGAAIYYNADFLNWLVDQSPVQALLNTTKWKFLIPQLYQKYPNKEIKLQFEVSNPPNVSLTLDGIDVYVTAKMIIGVADNNTNIEAACISIALSGSGIADINGNNITGHLVLNNLCLDLEWSSVGAIHLKLVEVFLRTLVKDFLLPFLNVSLKRGFPLPVIPSMKLKNSAVNYGNGFLLVCSDIEYVKGYPGNLN